MFVKIAECWVLAGDFNRAVNLLNRSLQLQPDLPKALLERALCRKRIGEIEGASDDLLKLLRIRGLDRDDVLSALRELRDMAPERWLDAATLPAVDESGRGICDLFADSNGGLPHAIRLMRRYLAAHEGSDPACLHSYLLRAGQYREVIEAYEGKDAPELGPGDLFDLAMARWAETGDLPADLCRLALAKDRGRSLLLEGDKAILVMHGVGEESGRPLFHYGALWLLLWGAGRGIEVLPLLDDAETEVKDGRRRPFSIWRLQEVSTDLFLGDCQQFRRMIHGEPIRPPFLGPPR